MWAVARLSQKATLPGAHRNRTWYSGRAISPKRWSRIHRLSSGVTSTMWSVKPGVTNSARSPVSGCTRTTGWMDTSGTSPEAIGVAVVAAGGLVADAVAVLGPQRVDERLHRLGQALVGGHEVGPRRVAAVGREDVGAQDRARRRVHRRGDVGVPAGEATAAPAAVAARAAPGRNGARSGGGPRCRSRGSRRAGSPRAGAPTSARRSAGRRRSARRGRCAGRGRRRPSTCAARRGWPRTSSSVSSADRSTPRISAPMRPVRGCTDSSGECGRRVLVVGRSDRSVMTGPPGPGGPEGAGPSAPGGIGPLHGNPIELVRFYGATLQRSHCPVKGRKPIS